MLYTDSDILTLADLIAIDSGIPSIIKANATPFDPSVTWNECRSMLLAACQSYGGYLGAPGIAAHNNAIMNVWGTRNVPRVRLNQIITHESQYGSSTNSPLKQWLAYRALYLFFRDVSNRLGVDKYQEKEATYKGLADGEAWRRLVQNGLSIVFSPMDAPGAKYGFQSGIWGASNTSSVAGGTNPSVQSVQVAITYYDSSRYVSQASKGNGESGPSAILTQQINANQLLKVDITSLTPPNGTAGQIGTAAGIYTPLNATHWNLYVGDGSGPMYLQQESIPIATKTWTLAGNPVYSGSLMGLGQFPDQYMPIPEYLMRG